MDIKKECRVAQRFTSAQMQWLRMIKDYVADSFHVEKDDFELDPFTSRAAWAGSTSCL